MDTLKLAARTGALFLDEEHPEWWLEINVDMLDMRSTSQCIIGQLFSGYIEGMEEFGMLGLRELQDEHGFDMPEQWYRDDEAWDLLAEAWVEEVKARL